MASAREVIASSASDPAAIECSVRFPQRSESGTELVREQFGLFPCREMSALVDFVEVDQVVVGTPCPCFWCPVDVLWKDRNGHGHRNVRGLLCRRAGHAASAV